MIPVKSFIKLSFREKIVFIKALFWVIVIRLFIWISPFSVVKKRVQKITIRSSNSNTSSLVTIPMIRSMVMSASRYVPRSTCLVRALAGYILFSEYGYTTQIKIGVSNEKGQFEAHAWLEKGDCVVFGASEKDYKTILDMNAETQ